MKTISPINFREEKILVYFFPTQDIATIFTGRKLYQPNSINENKPIQVINNNAEVNKSSLT